jgi:thiol-disulfide isomerase/thioredoxin
MKSVKSILVFVLLLISLSTFAENFTLVKLDKRDGDIKQQISKHVLIAKKLNQKVFLQIMAEWCKPCRALRASMNDPLMKEAFSGTYILQFDFDEWDEQLKSVGANAEAIPVFFKVTDSGVVTKDSIHGGAWKEDIPSNIAPALKKYFSK